MTAPLGAEIILDGIRYANFGGSSYLGLSGNPDIIAAGVAALKSNGAGYQFARSYGIASPAHLAAEQATADFFGTETAQFLPGGYTFGAIVLHSLRDRNCVLFLDAWAHMSLKEAASASGLPVYFFAHLDADDLRRQLGERLIGGQQPVVVTDGLYSTLGEVAPLGDIVEALVPYEGLIVIDESHSFGILGSTGRGALERFPQAAPTAIIGGSTGKAFGALGGIIPGSNALIEECRKAPPARGASVGLPAAAAMVAASFRHVAAQPEILDRLRSNSVHLKRRLAALGLPVGEPKIPIVALKFAAAQEAQRVHAGLLERGIYTLLSDYIGASERGTVRIGIFADHEVAQLDELANTLAQLL